MVYYQVRGVEVVFMSGDELAKPIFVDDPHVYSNTELSHSTQVISKTAKYLT